MNHRVLAVMAAFLLCTTTASFANEATPAWQEPGFVMEEIVVTARAADVLNFAQNPNSTRLRTLRGFGLHRFLLQRPVEFAAENSH